MGLADSGFVFHAGPIIRKEDGFALMNRELRGRIFNRMMIFARHVDFKYHCIFIDKKFVTSSTQAIDRLLHDLNAFTETASPLFLRYHRVKIYYDCGQAAITNLLHDSFGKLTASRVEFAQNVRPADYRLFQIADLVCTLKLLELKIAFGEPLTKSEEKFFGGERALKRNILRKLASKKYSQESRL